MNFSEDEKIKLAAIAAKYPTSIQLAIAAAYEEGLLTGAMRVAQSFANKFATAPTAPVAPTAPPLDDDEDSPLTVYDRTQLRARGIDPDKKFRIKNSLFTITAWKPSRWKFPVSGVNQNGTRYKFPITSVVNAQKR